MEFLATNISRPKYRRETLNGREHYVVPMTLIVPGVLNGSEGPLYYPKDEVEESTTAWNNIPIVVYHPKKDGRHVSARDPDVLNAQGVGVVMSAKANGSLSAEGWFDVARTRKIDNRVIEAIEAGRKMELSTGLFTKNEKAEVDAEFNGRAYDAVARKFQPDHVAILPDQKGACSIDDGCGVFNSKLSHGDLRDKLSRQLRERFADQESLSTSDKPAVDGPWTSEVFDKYFIYEREGKLYRLDYSIKGDEVELSEDAPVEVERVVQFKPVNNEVVGDACCLTGSKEKGCQCGPQSNEDDQSEQSGPESRKKGASVPKPNAKSRKKPLSKTVNYRNRRSLTSGKLKKSHPLAYKRTKSKSSVRNRERLTLSKTVRFLHVNVSKTTKSKGRGHKRTLVSS